LFADSATVLLIALAATSALTAGVLVGGLLAALRAPSPSWCSRPRPSPPSSA
jgi:hypothetical protein